MLNQHRHIHWGILVAVCLLVGNFLIGQINLTYNTAEAQTSYPLIQSNNLTYLGAFKVPGGKNLGGAYGFDYGIAGVAYNPANNSIFLTNHAYEQKTAELSIPALDTDMTKLQTATLLQNLYDITEGNVRNVLAGGAKYNSSTYLGGLLAWGNKLIGSSYIYYDGSGSARLSHFTHSTTLSQPSFQGMYAVGTLNPGFYNGYMANIPVAWQSAFGGPALTGQCCIPIISRTSFGPAAFVFNPDDVGVANPVPATPLVYYPQSNQTLGTWGNTTAPNLYYNMTTSVKGIVFPAGTQSVLFFGRQGIGIPCYGQGTTTQSLDRQPVPGTNGGVVYCYDPANGSKGNHAYPYKSWVWAYDANDLLAVKNGQKNPWDPRPYAIWELTKPVDSGGIQGAVYDSNTQRIYVVQSLVIHVFQVNNATPVPTPIPTPSPAPAPAPSASASASASSSSCASTRANSVTYSGARNSLMYDEDSGQWLHDNANR